MAEAQESLDVSDLKDTFLECPVCLEQFDQAERRPRLLVSCLHAFCTQCLEQLLKKEGGGQITCPNCRHVQEVKGNAQSLPVDPVRNKLVDYVQFKKGKQIPCTDCPEGSHAVSRCHDCQTYMCVTCTEAHQRNRSTRKHTSQSLQEALNEPMKNFLKHFCKDHPDYKIEFYCGKCSSLCCVSCSIVKHKGHDLDPIEEAANSMLSSLKTKMTDVDKSVSVLRKMKRSREQESAKHERNLMTTTASINQTFEELIRKLKTRQNKLISELKKRTKGTVNGLKKQDEASDDSLAQMESALEYFKQMETKSDDCEVLSAAPILVQSLEAYTAADQTQDVQYPTWTFSPGELNTISSSIHTLGELHSSTIKADASRIFNDFASLPGERTSSSYQKRIIQKELVSTREKLLRESELEERGAVGLDHRRDRDHEYTSFISTFRGDAAMLRDLDKAPKGELAAIEKWVEDTRKPDIADRHERGSVSSDELLKDSEETHPMSYDLGRYQGGDYKSGSNLRNVLEDTSQQRRPYRSSDFADETKNFEFGLPGGIVVKVHFTNIVKIRTDGIVNAANSELQHYAGVAGAIERACGRKLTRECEQYIRQNGPLNISEVMHTTSGDLIALGTSYILHTVGPVYVSSMDSKCGNFLTCTFLRCLDYARTKLRIRSIAFPFISSGVYGAPLDMCVESFLDAVVMYAQSHQDDTKLREIHLVNTDLEMVQTAIMMIKQHLENSFEILVSKAMSRLERKSKSPRSPRSEEKSPRGSSSVKRSSSLSRTATRGPERSEFSSLRPEDLHVTEDEPRSLKPTPRRRSGKFNAPRASTSDKPRASYGIETVISDYWKGNCSPRSDFSKTMPGVMKSLNAQGASADRYKTRPGTTPGANQPKGGKMSNQTLTDISVPGYKGARGAISIEYNFPGGLQQVNHPNPGKRYAGTKRTAYLPNNTEGREILRLLERAFEAGVTFTIGDSLTTGQKGVITWNGIVHKTSLTGGPESYGYPDPDYLRRVREELADKGITG